MSESWSKTHAARVINSELNTNDIFGAIVELFCQKLHMSLDISRTSQRTKFDLTVHSCTTDLQVPVSTVSVSMAP